MNREIFDIKSLLNHVRKGERPEYLFFWGHRPRKDGKVGKQCLSQWWASPFEIDGIVYRTAEHYMMAEKARLFEGHDIGDRIIACSNPKEVKKLGREIQNFNDDLWNEHRFEVVVQGNLAKFSQNSALQGFLRSTGRKVIVEASPQDTIWGIGLAEDDPNAKNPERWNGLNLLGFALMKVRSKLT